MACVKTQIATWLVLTIIMTASLTGCADFAFQEENSMADSAEETQIPFTGDKEVEEDIFLPATETKKVEVSDKKAAVYYAGKDFVKSVFAAGGTMLYVCGIKANGDFFLGYMQREEDIFQEFDLGMDEGLRALDMAVDSQGRCHILWMSVEKYELNGQNFDRVTYEKSCITVVDGEGRLEKEIDVSDIFASRKQRPFCLAVDGEGNYYFESEKELVQVMPDGAQGRAVTCDGWIEGIGAGKSGAVYCIYSEMSGEKRLARLEADSFSLSVCDADLPESDAIYAGIFAGTDSELLIFNTESGVFAYDGSGAEVRMPATELPVTGAEIVGYGILADGRACLMTQVDETTIFYYIPLGK